jgi:hypothetical protein
VLSAASHLAEHLLDVWARCCGLQVLIVTMQSIKVAGVDNISEYLVRRSPRGVAVERAVVEG